MADPNYNYLLNNFAALKEDFDKLSLQQLESDRIIKNVLNTQLIQLPYPSSNIIENGELYHSVRSWFDTTAGGPDDKDSEAANWFSHPISATSLDSTDARSAPYASVNNALKSEQNSGYHVERTHWNRANGWAELNGTWTLDTIIPVNYFEPSTPLAWCGLRIAKRNQYIEITDTCLMFAGLWDNTSGQRKFIVGSLGFSATLNAVAASTVERRYKIAFISDRGFTLVSPEITIANAPADGYFSSTANITLSWKQQAGQLQVDIYEYIPSLSEYRLIKQVSAATSYIHDGTYLDVVGSYPSGTSSEGTSIYYTKTGELAGIATDGVSATWDTLNFEILVASDYDKSNTTDRQWLRIGVTEACNLFITGVTSAGTTTLTMPEAIFVDEYPSTAGAQWVGLTVEVYDEDDVLLQTSTISSVTDDSHIVLAHSIATGTNRKIRVVAGGNHGILVDKIHLGFHKNVAYAPNANDVRTLQPVSAPTSSSQGGVGGGGVGGGIYNCVVGSTPIKQGNGDWKIIKTAKEGDHWASAEFHPNLLLKLRRGFDYVREVIAENGCYVRCTDSERFVVDRNDTNGTPLSRLRIGDSVLTEIDGKIESSKIIYISERLDKEFVYTPTLSNNRLFVGGEVFPTLWQRITKLFKRKQKKGGFVLHNLKYLDDEFASTY
jgi:hypothetical protein